MERWRRDGEDRSDHSLISRRGFLLLFGYGLAGSGTAMAVGSVRQLVTYEQEVAQRAESACSRAISPDTPNEVRAKIMREEPYMHRCLSLARELFSSDYRIGRELFSKLAIIGGGALAVGVADIIWVSKK